MKIKNYELFQVPPRWLFLKIQTDEGIVGWGEPVIEGKAATVKTAVSGLMEDLIGKDPMTIEDHWNRMYRSGFYRGGPILMSAIAGIDQALWDTKGKFYNAPVHQLMGGKARDKMKVYSWIGGDRPRDVAQAAKKMTEQGFLAVKMNATEELQYVDSYDKIDQAVKRIAAVREAVGPGIGIGIDFHGRVHKPMAKILAKSWRLTDRCLLKNRFYLKIMKRCGKLRIMFLYLLPQAKECSPGGNLKICLKMALLTLFNPIYRMPAE